MRATDLPDKWQLLLDAMEIDDFETAHEICTKYRFTDAEEPKVKPAPKRYRLHWISPSGNTGLAGSQGILGKVMGIRPDAISAKFSKDRSDEIEWMAGQNKGWKVRRELHESN